jgi:hypothetical protein
MKVRYTVGSKPEHRSVLLLNVHEPEKRTAALGAYFNGGTIFGYIRRVFDAHACNPVCRQQGPPKHQALDDRA